MTKPTQDKETLREAVARAMYESRDNYIPWGHITQKWRRFWYEQADAAIAAMFERLRTPSEGVLKAGVEAANKLEKALYQSIIENGQNSVDMDANYRTLAREQFIGTLTAFQQENSDER